MITSPEDIIQAIYDATNKAIRITGEVVGRAGLRQTVFTPGGKIHRRTDREAGATGTAVPNGYRDPIGVVGNLTTVSHQSFPPRGVVSASSQPLT